MIEWWTLHGAEIRGLLWYGYWLGIGMIGAVCTYGLVFWAVGEAKQIAFNVGRKLKEVGK